MTGTAEAHQLKAGFSPTTFALKKKSDVPGQKPKILVISGPTCVGKTYHSLLIAEIINGEIISADSMQVYKGMDIGTAKATLKERALAPHHLIDICDLKTQFNVADFYKKAMEAIHLILARGHVPIIVGGTGFYIHALIYGPPKGPSSQPEVRELLEKELIESGCDTLYQRLQHLDPEYANQITRSDRHKIVRALEIIALTDQKVSAFSLSQVPSPEYDFRCLFLYLPKEILYPHIEMRCDEMIAAGFIEEVRLLMQNGLEENPTAAQAIGYRQCIEFLKSPQTQEDFDHFVAAFKQASRRYAKRQFTWFRKEPLFQWMNVEGLGTQRVCEMILQHFEH